MTATKPPDELSLRYQEACAQDSRRPGERVRAAVHAHAAMVSSAKQTSFTRSSIRQPMAANQPHWKLSWLASVALLGLTGLLVLQFDRGTPEEQERVLGRSSTRAQLAPTATSSQPPAPAVRPAAGTVGESAKALTRTPRAVPAPKVNLARTERPPQMPDESDPARTATRESSGAPSSHLPSPTAEAMPAVASLSAQLADAAAVNPAHRGAVEKGGAAAGSARSALRAAKPVPAALAPGKDSPGVADLTLALHASARAGVVVQVEHLLKQGAMINAPDNSGRTALILAALNGHTDAVARLLALGANPALADHDGMTALQHAQRLGYGQIASLLGD